MKEKILIVDDDKEIRRLIEIYLKSEQFDTQSAENGFEALKLIEKETFDLVILDVMMPIIDGIDTCVKIREQHKMPIIMLSAKSEDMDKIYGLTTGADDYITKPFNPLELVARVKCQLRRIDMNTSSTGTNGIIRVNGLIINPDTREVIVDGDLVKLTPIEFNILTLLANNKNRVMTNQIIYETIWDEEFLGTKNSIMVHIRKIREKIEKDPRNPELIKTVWGVGYKLEG